MSVDQQDRDQNAAESGWQPQPQQPPVQPKKRHRVRNTFLVLAVGTVALAGTVAACGSTTETTSAPAPAHSAPAKPKTTPAAEESAAPAMTKAQEQAVGTAEDYISYTAFSRSGLIDQLKYEGYSKKDATFAVDHISVNWNKQAVKTAKDYLGLTHFSRSGLIDQLEFDGYTHSQAVYGVDGAGL